MRLIHNAGKERVIDLVRPLLKPGHRLDLTTPSFSLFAFAELFQSLQDLEKVRLLFPDESNDLALLGNSANRPARNQLQTRWLAHRCAEWISNKAEVRRVNGSVPQGTLILLDQESYPQLVVQGSLSFTTDGLGITPGNPLSLIQTFDMPEEMRQLSAWFEAQWSTLPSSPESKRKVVESLQSLAIYQDPYRIYTLILYHLFKDRGEEGRVDH